MSRTCSLTAAEPMPSTSLACTKGMYGSSSRSDGVGCKFGSSAWTQLPSRPIQSSCSRELRMRKSTSSSALMDSMAAMLLRLCSCAVSAAGSLSEDSD
eukprot:3939668-Pleurochrysis_carterae.AAC.1